MSLPLRIFEPRYRLMLSRYIDQDPIFGVVLIRSGREVGDQQEVHPVGTAASLVDVFQYTDGRFDIAVRGGRRFHVHDSNWDKGYLTGTIEWLPNLNATTFDSEGTARLADQVRLAFDTYLDAFESRTNSRINRTVLSDDPVQAVYEICSMMPFDASKRQRLLEAPSFEPLLQSLLSMLRRERKLLVSTGTGGANVVHPGTGFSTN